MVIEEAKILNKEIIITDIPARECIVNYNKATVLENTENGIYQGLKKILSREIAKDDNNLNTNSINTKAYEDIIAKVKSIL